MYSLTIINVQFFSATCYANIVGCCRRVSGFDYRHKAKQHNNRQMETDGLNMAQTEKSLGQTSSSGICQCSRDEEGEEAEEQKEENEVIKSRKQQGRREADNFLKARF